MNKLLLIFTIFSLAVFSSCGETKTAEETNEELEEVTEEAQDDTADAYEAFANQIKSDLETVQNKMNDLADDTSAEATEKKAKLMEIQTGLNDVNAKMQSNDQAVRDEASRKHNELKEMLNNI